MSPRFSALKRRTSDLSSHYHRHNHKCDSFRSQPNLSAVFHSSPTRALASATTASTSKKNRLSLAGPPPIKRRGEWPEPRQTSGARQVRRPLPPFPVPRMLTHTELVCQIEIWPKPERLVSRSTPVLRQAHQQWRDVDAEPTRPERTEGE